MIKKIQVMSDLHLDTQRRDFTEMMNEFINPLADMVIMAGDIVEYDEMNKFLNAIKAVAPYKEIVWVLGNHEYHHGNVNLVLENTYERIRKAGLDNIKLLENDTLMYNRDTENEFQIIGASLWTNLRVNPISEIAVKNYMSDFTRIKGITGDWWQEKHNESVRYIKDILQADTHTSTIVVTHHSPTFLAVPDQYKGMLTNYGYASDLEYCMWDDWAPNIWIHGHTHDPYDKVHGNTRVIRNPYGYRSFGEYVFEFDKNFLIDVSELAVPV